MTLTHRIAGLLLTAVLAVPVQAQGVSGARQVCDGGYAFGFSCAGVDLISWMPRDQLTLDSIAEDGFGNKVIPFEMNDMWGWKDEASGRSFLLVGRTDGTAFVETTDPFNPVFVGDLLSNFVRSNGNRNVVWRDIKVYNDHAYIVADGAPGHGVQVFDLRQLLENRAEPVRFEATAVYDRVSSVHNIIINEATGFAYAVGNRSGGETCGAGFHMIDLSTPGAPRFAGCHAEFGTSRGGGAYTHDAHCVLYQGPDSRWSGREICVGSNEQSVLIADVTDKSNPQTISIGRYPATEYTHQGWLSEDHRFFFQGDELDELRGTVGQTRTIVWDVSDLEDPVVLTEYFAPRGTIDHNMYVSGDLLFQSQYVDGLRIVDISDPANPEEIAFFDTHPDDRSVWDGSWSNYPFMDYGAIGVTSSTDGLFILQQTGGWIPESPSSATMRVSLYPNPVQDVVYLDVLLTKADAVDIEVTDVMGRVVYRSGGHRMDAGFSNRLSIPVADLASGVYFARVKGAKVEMVQQFVRAR